MLKIFNFYTDVFQSQFNFDKSIDEIIYIYMKIKTKMPDGIIRMIIIKIYRLHKTLESSDDTSNKKLSAIDFNENIIDLLSFI